MKLEESAVRSRFRGALLGLSIGDALAFPFRGRSRRYARSRLELMEDGFAMHESGFFPSGQFTAHTQTALATAAAFCESRGPDPQIVAEYLIPLWRDGLVVEPGEEVSAAVESLASGRATIDGSGLPAGSGAADALARAIVPGLWTSRRPDRSATPAAEICAVTHRDPRVLAASAAVAAAIAHLSASSEIVLRDFIEATRGAAGAFHGDTANFIDDFPRLLSITELRVFESVAAFVAEQTGVESADFESGIPDSATFALLMSFYYFLKSPFDARRALRLALGAGSRTTAVGALVGGLGGAFVGEKGLPQALTKNVLDAEETLKRANAFYRVWRDSTRKKKKKSAGRRRKSSASTSGEGAPADGPEAPVQSKG